MLRSWDDGWAYYRLHSLVIIITVPSLRLICVIETFLESRRIALCIRDEMALVCLRPPLSVWKLWLVRHVKMMDLRDKFTIDIGRVIGVGMRNDLAALCAGDCFHGAGDVSAVRDVGGLVL